MGDRAIALIGLLGVIISSVVSYRIAVHSTKDDYLSRIERLSRQNEGTERSLKACASERDRSKSEVARLVPLEEQLKRCTTTEGRIIETLVETSGQTKTINTGDKLALLPPPSKVGIKLQKVTKEGAVFKLEGCDNRVMLSSNTGISTDPEAFVLGVGDEFSIAMGCCSQAPGACSLGKLETTVVKCETFNIKAQTAGLHYRKSTFSAQPPPIREGPQKHDRILLVQIRLQANGFDPGPLDGRPGTRTTDALRAFQIEKGLPATGELNEVTQKALGL